MALPKEAYCHLSLDCESECCPRRMSMDEAIDIYAKGRLAMFADYRGECVFAAQLAAKYGPMHTSMDWLRIDKIEAEIRRRRNDRKAKKR